MPIPGHTVVSWPRHCSSHAVTGQAIQKVHRRDASRKIAGLLHITFSEKRGFGVQRGKAAIKVYKQLIKKETHSNFNLFLKRGLCYSRVRFVSWYNH